MYGLGLCRGHGKQKRKGKPLAPFAVKGGGHVTHYGYRLISRMGHPNAYPNGKIAEHRWVMSEMLGRPLADGEEVHHRNGNKLDNRPENLELWLVGNQPRGQRVVDLLDYAHAIIARYEREAPLLRP